MTGYVTKAGVDWSAIEQGVRAGTSYRSLAKIHGVSHVRIGKRAKKEGWIPPPKVVTETPLSRLVAETAETLPNAYKATDTVKASILQSLAGGSTLSLAAKVAGVGERTLLEWRADPEFAKACESAMAIFAQSRVNDVVKASERGDWRAGVTLLERHPLTRDEYGPPKTTGAGPQMRVILDIPAPKAVTLENVIDVDPIGGNS